MYKVGIIGCGGRGRAHAQGYQLSPDVEIIACSDPFEDSRNGFMERFEVERSYADYQEMLDKEDLDFVSVCTWIRLHTDMIVKSANSGIKAIHAEFSKFQVLCATRVGAYGTQAVNQRIEKQLLNQGKIIKVGAFYSGMPIMISENNYQLNWI